MFLFSVISCPLCSTRTLSSSKHASLIYIFIDNTFSRNKAKTLTFSVALVDADIKASLSEPQHEISGWLLKKKRKKMQGKMTAANFSVNARRKSVLCNTVSVEKRLGKTVVPTLSFGCPFILLIAEQCHTRINTDHAGDHLLQS